MGNGIGETKRTVLLVCFCFCCWCCVVGGIEILSKSKIGKCEKTSEDPSSMNCFKKVVLNMAVPSGSSGGEASIIAEIVEVEENSTDLMQTVRIPPIITINKSAAYALYQLNYIRDVPYKPEEFYVKTRKCERDADASVVKICERLRDEQGHIIEYTQPICCPCGPQRRMPSTCGNFFDKITKGKANTAHCLRFPCDWFHVFGIGQRSLGFNIRIEVKKGTKVSEVIVGPENRTVISHDKFLRVNLIGDFAGYTSIPSFEDFYLVIPRQGGPGQPMNLGSNFSMWMLLERVRFTLDSFECNKIGVSYEAFNGQPNFCSSPYWSCLHNQLWNYWDADQNRIRRNQLPLYGLQGRFERINQHPNAGTHSFSIGVTEVLNTNLLIELSADDIEYVYQRSPGQILRITVPMFEALTQFGVATITTKNTGEVEASYSLTFRCSKSVSPMEEQFFIMKPKEIMIRSFKVYPTTDQAAKYTCLSILKDSSFSEVDRAECQFTTTATSFDNGSQIAPFQPPKSGISGIIESIENLWDKLWQAFSDFITGRTCRQKCAGFLDFSCHVQYICMSWVVLFGLFLAIFPTGMVLLWLLHQKGFFDPLYDWWEDHCFGDDDPTTRDIPRHRVHVERGYGHHEREARRRHKHRTGKRRSIHGEHRHDYPEKDGGGSHYHLHVHKEKHKHGHGKESTVRHHVGLEREEEDYLRHRKRRKEKELKIASHRE